MFTRVLLPLDGSERAERAISTAAHIARASGGTLILAQVQNMDLYYYLGSEPPLTQELIEHDMKEGEAYLSRIAHLPELRQLNVEQVVMYGSVASTLLSLITSQAADLIVLTSHGKTGFTRWALGSTAEKIARYSSVPVLILREDELLSNNTQLEAFYPLRVLVPLDGSLYARAALEPAAQLIAALVPQHQATIHLLSVVKPASSPALGADSHFNRNWLGEPLVHKAKTALRSLETRMHEGLLAPSISRFAIKVTYSVALDTDIAHAIVDVAENGEDLEGTGLPGGCQLIVMATHGRNGLQRWAMGSITERVLHHTKLPLLVVQPTKTTTKQERSRQREMHHVG